MSGPAKLDFFSSIKNLTEKRGGEAFVCLKTARNVRQCRSTHNSKEKVHVCIFDSSASIGARVVNKHTKPSGYDSQLARACRQRWLRCILPRLFWAMQKIRSAQQACWRPGAYMGCVIWNLHEALAQHLHINSWCWAILMYTKKPFSKLRKKLPSTPPSYYLPALLSGYTNNLSTLQAGDIWKT